MLSERQLNVQQISNVKANFGPTEGLYDIRNSITLFSWVALIFVYSSVSIQNSKGIPVFS